MINGLTLANYIPTPQELWTGRDDGPRLHQHVECVDLLQSHLDAFAPHAFGIVGFACDEGVRRNHGRLGAFEGPTALRKAAVNMPLHMKHIPTIYDFGTVVCHDKDLETAQVTLAEIVSFLHKHRVKPIVLGGGHEVAFGHFQGIASTYPSKKCGILNFDAHFDMRPLLNNQLGTSGTPFLQIAELQKQRNHPFSYTCIGIQETGNTHGLFERAQTYGAVHVMAGNIHQEGLKEAAQAIKKLVHDNDILYVTLCLDVFASAFAPGVSAPQPYGLYPAQIIPLLKQIAQSKKVVGFDIAELAPAYDNNNATASLAAFMLYTFLHEYLRN